MTSPWQLLILEDSEDDFLLLTSALQQQGFAVQTERVDTAAALSAALDRQSWDAVLSDSSLPSFDAPSALRLVKANDPDLPVIIVSGVMGEEAAVSAMRAGAHDFLSKQHLARLGVSVAREIEDAHQRRALRAAEAQQGRLASTLGRALAEAELLDHIVTTAAGQDDLGQILTSALQHLSQLVAFTGGSIALLDQNTLTLHAAYGPFARQVLGQRLPRHPNSRRWAVIETGQPFHSPDIVAQGYQPTTPIHAYLAVPLTWRGQTFGLLEIDSTEAAAFTPADVALTQKVAARLSGPVELAGRVAAERTARQAEQVASDRVRRLHRLALGLASALLPEQVAEIAVTQGLEAMSAAAGLYWRLVPEPASLERVHQTNFPDGVMRSLEHMPLETDAPTAEAARTGQAIWLESAAAQATRYPARAALMRQTGFEALVFLPLAADQTLLGVLVFAFAQVHTFTPDEQAFLLALARLCAQALERARLYAAQQAARQAAELAADRVSRLQALTAALSQAVTPEAVMDTALREGTAALDTTAAAFNLITPDGQSLEVARSAGYPAERVARFRRLPLSAITPGTDVARTGEPVWLGTLADWRPRYAHFLDHLEQQPRPYPAAAVLPLRLSGKVVGNLTFGFASPRRFESADRAFVTAIVDQCAQALERAQLYAAERESARAAQLLAQASVELASAPAAETAAQQMLELVVPAFADLCWIELAGVTYSLPAVEAAPGPDQVWQSVAAQVRADHQPQLHSDAAPTSGSAPALTLAGATVCAYLAVPLAARGQVLGVMLWATTTLSNRWLGPRHLLLAGELGHRLALAVDNARLYAELEARVIERTAALQREVAERRAAEAELEHSRDLLRDLSDRLQVVREEERTRIAYRVHDELGQQLAGLKMDVSWLARHVQRSQPADGSTPLLDKLRAMGALLDSMVATVRLITTELRPGLLDDFGLPAAIEWQLQEFQQRTGIAATFEGITNLPLDTDRATALFRIVQEALNNVAWHAQATQVVVSLEGYEDHVRLQVQDNGRGITTGMLASPKALGLLGMRERARRLGGTLDIKSHSHGGGTQLIVRVPTQAA
jgi:signal transduction histidine kinase/FixJ family two-component response regulator